MSVFDEILCKLNEISSRYVSCLNDDIKVAFDSLDKFAEEYQNGRGKRETIQKSKNPVNTLQSIDEDEDEISPRDVRKSKEGAGEKKRLSNKRSKQEVDGMSSPEQEKRQKRNASVRAQNNITKQNLEALRILNQNIVLLIDDEEEEVNVSLTQKLRREEPAEKPVRVRKDKENVEPVPLVRVKQEKISLPPEPMELEIVPGTEVKQETVTDDSAMPPPSAPVPKPRSKAVAKDKSTDSEEEQSGKRRTRTRKQTDSMPPPPAPAERAPRASRAPPAPPAPPAPAPPDQPAPRPKRTRGKKKASESSTTENESSVQENCIGSPAEKPRPKRTRRGQKAAEKEAAQKPPDTPEPLVPKEERVSQENTSPAIPQKTVKKTKNPETSELSDTESKNKSKAKSKQEAISLEETQVIIEPKNDLKSKKAKTKVQEAVSLEETQVICPLNATVTIMDKTVDLPNGLMDHTDGKNTKIMDETVVIDKNSRETMVIEKPQAAVMNATVVLEKESVQKDGTPNITDDMSLLTDDSDTPAHDPPEPTSAVKAKVQQFEEMAARTTRTKTRAMAKKAAETENCTPPDKISKPILSAETLTKMNNMIFNGKTTQISASASKPTCKIPPPKAAPASASKLSALSQARDEHDARSKDDARKKKEAMLEAKKEQQRRKREDKMAAAAAARELAEKERRAAMQAAARERMEKQAHADQGKLERLKEVEKRKAELARKAAETEERRRGEERARRARRADDLRRAQARERQLEESEATKKEAMIMAKEIEKRHKEYLEKQKMKQKMEADKMHTPLKNMGTPCGKAAAAVEPVYMCDGFQYLNSDSEDDETRPKPKVPAPAWGTSKARYHKLALQHLLATSLVDRLFSVRVHSPDLRAIFPALERRELKRTSSAVWRTPPPPLSRAHESPI